MLVNELTGEGYWDNGFEISDMNIKFVSLSSFNQSLSYVSSGKGNIARQTFYNIIKPNIESEQLYTTVTHNNTWRYPIKKLRNSSFIHEGINYDKERLKPTTFHDIDFCGIKEGFHDSRSFSSPVRESHLPSELNIYTGESYTGWNSVTRNKFIQDSQWNFGYYNYDTSTSRALFKINIPNNSFKPYHFLERDQRRIIDYIQIGQYKTNDPLRKGSDLETVNNVINSRNGLIRVIIK